MGSSTSSSVIPANAASSGLGSLASALGSFGIYNPSGAAATPQISATPNVNVQASPQTNAAATSTTPGSTSVTTTTLPSYQLPYEEYGLNQALSQYGSVTSPSQLVAPLSSQQNQAITGITNLATNGTPEETAANNYVTNVLSGNPANNPYLNSEFQLGANAVQNQLESEFAGSGANVLSSAPVQADELNNLATQLYGGAYNTGVQQQEAASSLAPTLDTQQYNELGQLNSAGQEVQNQAQNLITYPQNFLNQYLSEVSGNLGSTASTVNPASTTQSIAQILQLANLASTAGSSVSSLLNSF